MERHAARIDDLRIQTPCPKSWGEMDGDERKRFCDHCSLHVHNASALTRAETEDLLVARAAGARLCMRIERDADGSVRSVDDRASGSPPPRAGLRRAASWIVLIGGSLLAACKKTPAPDDAGGVEPPPDTAGQLTQPGSHELPEMGDIELGKVCLPVEPEPVELLGEVCVEPVDEE